MIEIQTDEGVVTAVNDDLADALAALVAAAAGSEQPEVPEQGGPRLSLVIDAA